MFESMMKGKRYQMHIIFNPPENPENKYIGTMVSALRDDGFFVHNLDGLFSSWKHFRSIKLVHLNWFENLHDDSPRKAIISFFRKFFVLSVIKFSGKKLVWTMHNRASHEKTMAGLGRVLRRLLIAWSDTIVIHTKVSEGLIIKEYPNARHKLLYLPHPDFIGIYGDISSPADAVDQSKLNLLFVGAVKPYKNIELLIDVASGFGSAVHLTIAGKASTPAYQASLEERAKTVKNIDLQLRFVADEELPQLIADSDVLVLPYDLASSLNSGTVILAFSYQRTVICPRIGTLADMDAVAGNLFTYEYGEKGEHLAQLGQQIASAIEKKRGNPLALDTMGTNMLAYVSRVHNKSEIGKQLSEHYRGLINI